GSSGPTFRSQARLAAARLCRRARRAVDHRVGGGCTAYGRGSWTGWRPLLAAPRCAGREGHSWSDLGHFLSTNEITPQAVVASVMVVIRPVDVVAASTFWPRRRSRRASPWRLAPRGTAPATIGCRGCATSPEIGYQLVTCRRSRGSRSTIPTPSALAIR